MEKITFNKYEVAEEILDKYNSTYNKYCLEFIKAQPMQVINYGKENSICYEYKIEYLIQHSIKQIEDFLQRKRKGEHIVHATLYEITSSSMLTKYTVEEIDRLREREIEDIEKAQLIKLLEKYPEYK